MVKWMIKSPRNRVLGIGIDYREDNAPIENFWKDYRLAEHYGLRLTGHCSEFGLHWRYDWLKQFDELRQQLGKEPEIPAHLHISYGAKTTN